MSTTHTRPAFAAELPTISRAEIDRHIREAERRRAEALAELLRSAGRGIARFGAGAARLVWERAGEEIRYRQGLRELRRLDERTLDDLALGRADLPEIARRHASMAV